MGEAKKRKYHTPEYKAKVGLEALRGVKTINEIGQEYGVPPVQVGQWKKEIQEKASQLFEGKRGPKPAIAHQEPEKRYSEIGKLKMELDWLRKSRGFACHDTTKLDRSESSTAHYPAMRHGQCFAVNGVRPAKTASDRRK